MKTAYAHQTFTRKKVILLIIKLYYNFILTRISKITKLMFKALFPLSENQTYQILTLKQKIRLKKGKENSSTLLQDRLLNFANKLNVTHISC